jgi:hypothetical protein
MAILLLTEGDLRRKSVAAHLQLNAVAPIQSEQIIHSIVSMGMLK